MVVENLSGLCNAPTSHSRFFAWAVSTTDFSVAMTSSGLSAPKIAVPATMTLLPNQCFPINFYIVGAKTQIGIPAWAQTSTVLGLTPPSTSMSLSGKRARSSATLGTQRSINFCPPRPENIPFGVQMKSEKMLTGIDGHDEKQIGELANLVRYRSGGRVRGNCHPRLHAPLMDGVDKGDGIRCIAVSGGDRPEMIAKEN